MWLAVSVSNLADDTHTGTGGSEQTAAARTHRYREVLRDAKLES